MIFKRKPISVQYIEKCLISPPVFPGAKSDSQYVSEESLLLSSKQRSISESSEIFGEVIGSLCTSIVIASCIVAASSKSATPKVQRKLEMTFDRLVSRNRQIISLIPNGLDLELVRFGAERTRRNLLFGCEENVVLQSEVNVDDNFRKVRFYSLNIFGVNTLIEKHNEGIQSYIQYRS